MLCTVHTPLMSLFFISLQLFIFFHLSHMTLEVELTRNIDIKNDGLRGRRKSVLSSLKREHHLCWGGGGGVGV